MDIFVLWGCRPLLVRARERVIGFLFLAFFFLGKGGLLMPRNKPHGQVAQGMAGHASGWKRSCWLIGKQESGYSWDRRFSKEGRWWTEEGNTLEDQARGEGARTIFTQKVQVWPSSRFLFFFRYFFCLVCAWVPSMNGRWGVGIGDHIMVLTSKMLWGCFNASILSFYLVGWYLV